MKQCIDLMLVILPFEKTYFTEVWQWDVNYVGHPLIEVIEQHPKMDATVFRQQLSLQSEEKVIALLPGSRKQEILAKLPIMLEVSQHFPAYRFVVAMAPGQDASFYAPLLAPYKNVAAIQQKTYDLLSNAEAALVTSGTATLETALLGVPEIVCYKGSTISYSIAKRILKIKYISLVNLIMDRLIVKELIQDELTVSNIRNELSALLTDEERKKQLKKDYGQLRELLQAGGKASENAAQCIAHFLNPTNHETTSINA
jgi:lipid-A-disaccharide synthase